MLAPGTRLGPYEILSAIGSGGMGEVYKARDTRLDRTVAIKVLLPQTVEAPHLGERFEREARAVSRLSHPHICTLHDIGEAPAPAPNDSPLRYLVMELVEGETLAARLERGPLPIDQAVLYAAQIADAVASAHRAGIVHGDLKPGNVMVTKTGVKLLDFGLATERYRPPPEGWSDAVTGTAPIASPGTIVGTLQYLAPEQLEGKESDERTDIFACGVVIHEMVTGRKAFDGHSQASVIAAILRQDTPAISTLQPLAPPALDHVVSTCLSKDPDERWQHAGDLARELKWIAAVGARASAEIAVSARGTRARVWMFAAGVLALTTLVLAWGRWRQPAPETLLYRTSILLPQGLRFSGAGGGIGGVGRFAISPDGRRMAFAASDSNGNQMLWLRPLDSLVATPLAGTDGATSPFWSPDSLQIAFVAQGQLKRIDPAEGAPVVITAAFNATGAWTRDNTILFTPTVASPLHSIAASGGTPRQVTTLDKAAGDVLHRNPSLLPDGRHFLYTAAGSRNRGTIGPRAVLAGSLDPSEKSRLLIDSGSTIRYSQGYVILVRENMLLAQRFDLDRLTLTGEPRPIAEQVELIGPASAAFTVSDTGVLAYQPSGEGSQLVWFDREGRQMGAVGDPAAYGDVELSPDGRRAAVSVSDPVTNTRDLWIVEIERGVRTRLTVDPSDDVAPVWSPDGMRVMFASNRGGHFDLYQKAATGIGSEARVFTDTSEKYPTSWSPDGRSLLYWAFDADGANVFILPLGGEDKPKHFLGSPVSPGRLSPNGRWVSYYSSESGRSEIYVVPFPIASRRWQVSAAGGSLSRWRGDGKEIFFAGRDNRLMAATVEEKGKELDVGQARPLFEARPVGPRSFYDVTADGQRFLVNSLRGESPSPSITIVQSWSRALRP